MPKENSLTNALFDLYYNEKILYWGSHNHTLQKTLDYLAKNNYKIDCLSDVEEIKKSLSQANNLSKTVVLVGRERLESNTLEELEKFPNREHISIILLLQSEIDQEQKADLKELKIDYLSEPFLERDILECLQINLEYQAFLKGLQKRHQILETLIEKIPLMIVLLDPEQKIVWHNQTWQKSLGWSLEETKGVDFLAYCYPDEKGHQEASDKRWKDFITKVKNGSTIHTAWISLKLENDYQINLGKDITERKKAQEALEESEYRFRLITENMKDLVCIHDLEGRYIYVSPSCQNLLGYEPEEMLGRNPYDLVHPDDCQRVYEESHLIALQKETNSITYRIRTRSGEYIWLETISQPILNELGNPIRLQTASREITARMIVEEQFRHRALHNSLTDLPNRTYLLQQLQIALLESQRDQSKNFAVLMIDIDKFQLINDSVGYEVGDEVLIAIGERLKNLIPGTDFLAHLGVDEFVLILFDIENQEGVFSKTEFIRQQMFLPFNVSGRLLFTSASIGIAVSSDKYSEGEALLRDAQIATSRAKATGQGHYQLFDEIMYKQVIRRLQLETDLRLAIQREEFELYYQPIISISKENQIIGFESLLRWRLPNGRRVSPAEFIPVTEDTGMIITIGEWVLRQACSQLSKWQAKYPHLEDLSMSVNLSGRQLREQNLIYQLDKILQETGCSAENLRLEITESILIENAEFVTPLLTELKNRQIKLSLDDFGTGFSSLSYLNRFPVDALKLDRSFIQKIDEEERNFKIVQSIISLAHKLEMKVIAEGVETEQQLIYLKALECDYIQGYYFSKPLPKDEAEAFLESSLVRRYS